MKSILFSEQNKIRRIIRYLMIAVLIFVAHASVFTYLPLYVVNVPEHRNVVEQEVNECIQKIRGILPWYKSFKITLHKDTPDSSNYTVLAYGLYGIHTNFDLVLSPSYKESVRQGAAFSCKGELSNKLFYASL